MQMHCARDLYFILFMEGGGNLYVGAAQRKIIFHVWKLFSSLDPIEKPFGDFSARRDWVERMKTKKEHSRSKIALQ